MKRLGLQSVLFIRRTLPGRETESLGYRSFTTFFSETSNHRSMNHKMTFSMRQYSFLSLLGGNLRDSYGISNNKRHNINRNTAASFSALGSSHSDGDDKNFDEKSSDNQSNLTRKEKIARVAKKSGKLAKKGAGSAKELIQKYGWSFVGTYLSLYAVTLGSLFVAVDTGVLDPIHLMDLKLPWSIMDSAEDAAKSAEIVVENTGNTTNEDDHAKTAVKMIVEKLETFEFTKPYAEVVQKNPHFANFAIAWVATKVTEPIRLAITVGILPYISGKKSMPPNNNDK